MKVYIGAAIDAAIQDPVELFKELSDLVLEAVPDCIIYNPLLAFVNAKSGLTRNENIGLVKAANWAAIEASDLGVFIWNDSPSFGVPIEIVTFVDAGKHIVVWDKSSKGAGLYLIEALRPTRQGLSTKVLERLDLSTRALERDRYHVLENIRLANNKVHPVHSILERL